MSLGWAVGAWLLLRLTLDALLQLAPGPSHRLLQVGALAAAAGGLLLSRVVPMFLVGFGQSSVAEDHGYAPPGGTLGQVSAGLLMTGAALLLGGTLACLYAAGARLLARGASRE